MKYFFRISIFVLPLLFTGCLQEDDITVIVPSIQGSTIEPEVGGPTQPNQVWIDLSAPVPESENEPDLRMKLTDRTAWDLGFYGGSEFFAVINSSILMASGAIDMTDIDSVNESHVSSLKSILNPTSGYPAQYIDAVTGNYLEEGTAIATISENNSENKVYLLKLGYEIYQGNVVSGAVYTSGLSRGWKKIRILRSGNDYILQYADISSTTHQEVVISKNSNYNFTFYSIVNNNLADIQPPKNNWDICFTVMNNVIDGHGTYIYSDFVTTNNLANVGVYEYIIDNPSNLIDTYNNFTSADVDDSRFIYNDQRIIGSNWRSVFDAAPTPDRFYVIRDPEGILFKLRFIRMVGDSGEIQGFRGYPQFEYDPIPI